MANNNLKSNAAKFVNSPSNNKALPDVFKELEEMRKTHSFVEEQVDLTNAPRSVKMQNKLVNNMQKASEKVKTRSKKASSAVKESTQKLKSKVENLKSEIDKTTEKVKKSTQKTSNKISNRVNGKSNNLYLDEGFDLPRSSYQLKHMAEMQKMAEQEEVYKAKMRQNKLEEKLKKQERKIQDKQLKEQEKQVRRQNREFERQARENQRLAEEQELMQQIYDRDVAQANQNAVEQLYQRAQRVNMMANGAKDIPIKQDTRLAAKQKKQLTRRIQREKMSNYIKTRSFKDPVAIAFIAAILVLGGVIAHSFLTDVDVDTKLELANENLKKQEFKIEEKREVVGGYEKNYNSINISQILEENLQTVESKELLVVERDVQFETEYTENSKMPLGEQMVIQAGRLGREEVSFIRTYKNDEVVSDNIININTITSPVAEKIDVGSNQYLANIGAHLNDTVYISENTPLMMIPDTRGQEIGTLVKYFDVKLLDIQENGWAQIKIYDYVGYCDSSKLISINQDPTIADKSRRQKIIKTVNENMSLNVKSGLTAADFTEILSNLPADKNKIFENNANVFYNVEQQYDINGIFVAAIGIHESGWGTSAIALDKNNLFGYGAYDSDPYNMSLTFSTYEEGINLVARNLVKYYLNAPGTPIFGNQSAVGTYYNGPTCAGVNIRYATDTSWHTKVYNTMAMLYERIAPE